MTALSQMYSLLTQVMKHLTASTTGKTCNVAWHPEAHQTCVEMCCQSRHALLLLHSTTIYAVGHTTNQ